jgi:hypothetical protein
MIALVATAAAAVFLLTIAIGLNLHLPPRPNRVGFDVFTRERTEP